MSDLIIGIQLAESMLGVIPTLVGYLFITGLGFWKGIELLHYGLSIHKELLQGEL